MSSSKPLERALNAKKITISSTNRFKLTETNVKKTGIAIQIFAMTVFANLIRRGSLIVRVIKTVRLESTVILALKTVTM